MIWNVNPIALSFGVFEIYWYGILFFLAIISATVTMQIIYRIEKLPSEYEISDKPSSSSNLASSFIGFLSILFFILSLILFKFIINLLFHQLQANNHLHQSHK